MKVYVLSAIFTSDLHQGKSFLLTSDKDSETLPIIEIEYGKHFHNEIYHKIKSLFVLDSIKVRSDCNYNFLDIQNSFAVDYTINKYDFVNEEDLIITYGGVLLKYACEPKFKWTDYKLNPEYNAFSSDMNLNLLLDNVISRTHI